MSKSRCGTYCPKFQQCRHADLCGTGADLVLEGSSQAPVPAGPWGGTVGGALHLGGTVRTGTQPPRLLPLTPSPKGVREVGWRWDVE